MGAFAIDVPVTAFLRSIMIESAGLSVALFLAFGAIGFVISNLHFRQITERETAAAELGRTRTFLHTIIENMPAVVIVKNVLDRRYALLNRTAELLFGISRADTMGKRTEEIFPDQDMTSLTASDEEVLRTGSMAVIDEHAVRTPNHGTRILTTKKLVIPGDDGAPQYLLSLSEDITERKHAQERIAHMAHHDALTDLPNRAAFAEHLARTLERGAAGNESFAVLSIDLDRFKEINDIFGHSIGDAFLRDVSKRFQAVAKGAFLARLGGDEFTFVTPYGPQPALAEALAARLHAMVAGDLEVEGQRLRTGLSIGVAIYPTDGTDATVLLNNADASLYRAKAEGRGKTRFFEIEMDKRLRERRALQHELRSALSRGELSLHYQPQARIGGEVVGLEALIRWHNPNRGNVPPSDFIPIAEESGLIISIGEWVLREACREAASWPRPLTIAVNLSPIQFRHGDLAGLIHSILLETGLPANRLELEITEGVLVEDFNRALNILRRLKALGVRVAMDDFGTGYSSLSYLKAFPFDKIKIDRSFITNVDRNPQSTAIVCAVIGLARGLQLPVLAEGVETEGELAFLSRESCDEVQGYLVGKPLPIADYAEVVGRSADGRPAARATA
jgi:diguanylate cyclase (GGDEF)-like protein/PAS domain S-box-containing protein